MFHNINNNNNNNKPYYLLNLFVDSSDVELKNLYKQSMDKHNTVVESYFNSDVHLSVHVDAGFDLFAPHQISVNGLQTQKVNHKVKSAMEFVQLNEGTVFTKPVGYYLYPRSSTGSKTPLRLANSVGIIDSGYRGDIIAVFDNWQEASFTIEPYQRLAQLCPPNLTYPIYVRIVENDEDLGLTMRGAAGFGSTGQ